MQFPSDEEQLRMRGLPTNNNSAKRALLIIAVLLICNVAPAIQWVPVWLMWPWGTIVQVPVP